MNVDLGWACVSLLPTAPYSVIEASRLCVLGLALERQRGVHTVGSDRRQDFDAWPGDLAVTASNVDMFSESRRGGEYLTVRLQRTTSTTKTNEALLRTAPRTVFRGDRQAMQLGWRLRKLMLSAQPQRQSIEDHTALLLDHSMSRLHRPCRAPGRYELDRQRHARVMQYIHDALDTALSLDELADVAGLPLLRFLRSFSQAVGSTPHAYITEARLQKARTMLHTTNDSLAAISLECGFAHQSHLGAAFKERLGVTPGEYRELQR